jgi:hypothetical protein
MFCFMQLWSDSQKQAEVIGGHKSWLVIDDVQRMIEQEEWSIVFLRNNSVQMKIIQYWLLLIY